MTTRRRRGLAGLLAVASLAGSSLVMAGPAAAEDPGDGSVSNPYQYLDNLPIELINCNVEPAPGAVLTICIEITLDGGAVKFGKISSTVGGPIKVRQAVSAVITGFDPETGLPTLEIVDVDTEETSGGTGGPVSFPAIDVPGGLVGVPALNDLLKPVTGVQAQIIPLTEITITDVAPFVLLYLLGGIPFDELDPLANQLAVAHFDFKVQVKNLLLGETCFIGSEADPVGLNLPLKLTNGTYWNNSYIVPTPTGDDAALYVVAGADATDATFDIPAGRDCGIAGLGKALNDAGLPALNVFDTLLNTIVGLPAPAGTNILSLKGAMGVTAPNADNVPG